MNVLSEYLSRREYAPLTGKKIILGLTASSAIYKSIDLARGLIRLGAEIDVVMTSESLRLIGPDLVEWAIGRKPYLETTGSIEHITLAYKADALVIAPITLKSLSKIAYGYTDELLPLLTSAMLGLNKKVIVIPTMNIALYNSPQYKMVEEKIKELGIHVLLPYIEEDRVKYPPLNDLLHCIDALVNRGRDLMGLKALVTAGPTREYIDPVRILTNPSTGYMGIVIARELACRGAIVDLVHGPLLVKPPYMVNKYLVETTSEMAKTVAMLTDKKKYDIAIYAGAPADFTVLRRSNTKIPTRETRELTISLKPTIKVVKRVSKRNRPSVNIIFVAETVETHSDLVEKARSKIIEYNADMAVANKVSPEAGFASPYIDACIVSREEHICYGVIFKDLIARVIVDKAVELLNKTKALTRDH